jgi:uncharacterized protein YdeI (YjbR/CyaY-like superfamily)
MNKSIGKSTDQPKEAPEDGARRFATARSWETWLGKHHESSDGLWLLISRPGAEKGSVSYPEALEVALCHGWIDGQRKADDAQFYLQRFSPRTAKSIWSKINRDKALALIASGQMKPAGLKEVERAQADGRWDKAYDGARSIAVPDDLQAALAAEPTAAAFFKTLSGQNRYAVLFRIHHAKKPETRARRIQTFVQMLARHETLHP